MAKRLGWLGPAIVIAGALVAIAGLFVMLRGRPEVGPVLDTLHVDDQRSLVIRAEDGGERNFVELVEGGEVRWRAIVPPYAGRPGAPGIAWGQGAVTVRVIRDDRAEIFALAQVNATKIGSFKLAPGKGPVKKQTSGPVTLTDHERSYELVVGDGWAEVVAIDLGKGEALWKQDLGAIEIEDAGLEGETLWIQARGGARRSFGVRDGAERVPDRS